MFSQFNKFNFTNLKTKLITIALILKTTIEMITKTDSYNWNKETWIEISFSNQPELFCFVFVLNDSNIVLKYSSWLENKTIILRIIKYALY